MQLNRSISFTYPWLQTTFIAGLVSTLMVFILVFLQPFDTYQSDIPFKTLKLSGYGLCLLLPVLLIHIAERYRYSVNGCKWYITDEIIALISGFALMCVSSYYYHHTLINSSQSDSAPFPAWAITFVVPFVPILLPFWAYLRYRFSMIRLFSLSEGNEPGPVTLYGRNQNESLQLDMKHFIMAQAQANYVDVYLLDDDELVKKHTLRTTLSGIVDQMPDSRQIHRSYLINLDYADGLHGNTRKGWVSLRYIQEKIPVSPKYFTALKEYLQNRPNPSN